MVKVNKKKKYKFKIYWMYMRFNVKSQDFYRKQSPVKENRVDVRDMTSNPNKNRNFKCFTGWAVGSDSWAHQNATFNLFIIGVPASLLQPTLSSKTKIFNYIMSNQPTNQRIIASMTVYWTLVTQMILGRGLRGPKRCNGHHQPQQQLVCLWPFLCRLWQIYFVINTWHFA